MKLIKRPRRDRVDVHVREAMAGTTVYIHVRLRGVWRLRLAVWLLRSAALACYWLAGFRTAVTPVPTADDLLRTDPDA